MKYLFLLISFLYAFGFYLLHNLSQNKNIFGEYLGERKNILNTSLFDSQILSDQNLIVIQSFFGDLRIETVFFAIVGMILFFYFSPPEEEKKSYETKEESFLKKEIIGWFFKKFSYFIGFFLFYISIFFIAHGLGYGSFSWFVCVINIVILFSFFGSKFSKLSLDFLRVNSLLFSLSYIGSYLYIFITGDNFFGIVDAINSFFIIGTFLILLYFDKKINKKKLFDYSLIAHFSTYLFFVFLFYFLYFFQNQNIIFLLVVLCNIFGFLWFEYLPKIKFFQNYTIILRYIGILFNYLGILAAILYIVIDWSWIMYAILILQALYQYFIHSSYTNIISYGFALLSAIFVVLFGILKYGYDVSSELFLGILFSLSYVGVLGSYFFEGKTSFEKYILHIFCHLLNVFGVGVFLWFYFSKIPLWGIGVFFLIESLYFFGSYYKLQKY